MSINQLTTNIISQMGNSSGSLLPILTKDLSSSTLQTYVHSKKGGFQDGKERAIEEFGTCFIWIAGIPILKKIFDKTIYKLAKINPNVDIRKFNEKHADNIEFTKNKLAKDSFEFKELQNALQHKNLSKGLFASKFVVATLGTMAALVSLITYKQKATEQDIEKKYLSQSLLAQSINNQKNMPSIFQDFKGNLSEKPKKDVSFKGAGAFFADFMFNPVKNMAILDGSITTTRLANGRKEERDEILIKEGAVIAFYYFLAKPIQNVLEKISEKLFKRPIGLDYKVLSDPEFKTLIADKENLNKSIEKFKEAALSGKNEILNFVWDKADEPVVKLLKKSGEVPTLKENAGKFLGIFTKKVPTEKIDALSYMDTDSIKDMVTNLEKTLSGASAKNVDKFIAQAKKLKTASIFLNIAIAVTALGIIQPLITLKKRLFVQGDTQNPAIKAVENKYKANFNLA